MHLNIDILNKVVSVINKGLTDEKFIYEVLDYNFDIEFIYYNSLSIKRKKNAFIFSMVNINTKKERLFYCLGNDEFFLDSFEFSYYNDHFFKAVVDYLYNIEEAKHNKDILSNTFKQAKQKDKIKI